MQQPLLFSPKQATKKPVISVEIHWFLARPRGFEPLTYRFVGIETGAKRVILCTNLSNVPKKLVEF